MKSYGKDQLILALILALAYLTVYFSIRVRKPYPSINANILEFKFEPKHRNYLFKEKDNDITI